MPTRRSIFPPRSFADQQCDAAGEGDEPVRRGLPTKPRTKLNMKKPTKLNGSITISRWTSNGDPNTGVTISVQDELSGTQFVQIHLSVEQFGMAITNSQQDCQFEFRPAFVGKQFEHKYEVVPYLGHRDDRKAQEEAVKPFETDGWMCNDWSSLYNHYRMVKAGEYRVGFVRYVDPKP